MECSAKTSLPSVREVFITFQQLARIPLPNDEGLKRRSSAQARVNNAANSRKFAGTNSLSPSHACSNDNNNSNHNQKNINNNGSDINQQQQSSISANNTPVTSPRLKPRSRSLIRRTSKRFAKSKENSEVDDCTVS